MKKKTEATEPAKSAEIEETVQPEEVVSEQTVTAEPAEDIAGKETEVQVAGSTLAPESSVEVQNAETTAENSGETEAEDELHGENLSDKVKVLSPGKTVAKRFFRSKLSVIGLVTIVFLFLFAFIGPLFSPWQANGGTVQDFNPALIVDKITQNPISYVVDGVTYRGISLGIERPEMVILGNISGSHWLGTDEMGYDVLTRLMLGGRVSLTIGFVIVILETILGVVLGGLAGYFGKWVDNVIMRIVDVLSCIPSLPIMLILSVIFADAGMGAGIAKLYYMMMVLCLIGWTGTARLVRGQILSLREQEFMLAAKASGLSTASKIFKHLLPNVIPQLIVSMTLGLGSTILMEATLGFLGIGAPLNTATWGNLINLANTSWIRDQYPNLWVGAGVCITLAILAFNFVGDGLRDAFDPKMKR